MEDLATYVLRTLGQLGSIPDTSQSLLATMPDGQQPLDSNTLLGALNSLGSREVSSRGVGGGGGLPISRMIQLDAHVRHARSRPLDADRGGRPDCRGGEPRSQGL